MTNICHIFCNKSLETPAKSKHPPVYASMKSRNVNLMKFLVGGTCLPGFHHSLVFHHTCGILSGLKLNIASEIASKDLRTGIFHYPSSGSHDSAHFEWKWLEKFSIMYILLIIALIVILLFQWDTWPILAFELVRLRIKQCSKQMNIYSVNLMINEMINQEKSKTSPKAAWF